jgi:hypothetical protein
VAAEQAGGSTVVVVVDDVVDVDEVVDVDDVVVVDDVVDVVFATRPGAPGFAPLVPPGAANATWAAPNATTVATTTITLRRITYPRLWL